MSEAIKPTPGPCWADGQVVHSDAVTCIAKFADAYPARGWSGSDYAIEGHKEANAELFAEALNVHDETGLSPRQLAERYAELLEALETMVEFFQPNAWGSNENQTDALVSARAALAKCQPKEATP